MSETTKQCLAEVAKQIQDDQDGGRPFTEIMGDLYDELQAENTRLHQDIARLNDTYTQILGGVLEWTEHLKAVFLGNMLAAYPMRTKADVIAEVERVVGRGNAFLEPVGKVIQDFGAGYYRIYSQVPLAIHTSLYALRGLNEEDAE